MTFMPWHQPERRWPTPPVWLIGAVVLAHALLLLGTPRRDAPAPSAARAVPVLTRAIAPAPQPTATTQPAAPPAQTHAAQEPTSRAPAAPPAARAAVPRAARAVIPRARPADRPAPVAARAAPTTAPEAAPTAAATPTPSAPVRIPDAATLRYQVTGVARGLAFETDAELHWRREGARYEAVWSARLPLGGTRTQRSEGAITPAGLAPERYGESARGERAAHFDAAGARIRFSANTPDALLEAGAQDRLSATLQLAALLAAAPERYPVGTRIRMQTAGTREADHWVWEVQPDETLLLAGRELPSAKLVREPRGDYDSRIELWLARALEYLPVRLRATRPGGDVADQQLSGTHIGEPAR